MAKVRQMDQPEDLEKLGLEPGKVHAWEDGRRANSVAGVSEVWYFDANLDDGSKAVFYAHPRSSLKIAEDGDNPDVGVMITAPDGSHHGVPVTMYPAEECSFGTEKCDIQVGPHTFVGDFADYDIHIEPIDGVGLDLHFHALVEPFRQGGTGIIALGDDEEFFYTDVPVVRNEVTGTLTYDGKTVEVTGLGYHDHQWFNINPMVAWHHWLWGRMYTENYTVYIYDFVASEQFGFTPVPFFGVQDNRTGKTVFETDGTFTRETTLSHDDTLDRDFPKVSDYVFTNADGAKVELRTEWLQQLEARNNYELADPATKKALDVMGAKPVYGRYFANGKVTFIDADGESVTESGEMIYEYPYNGTPDPAAQV